MGADGLQKSGAWVTLILITSQMMRTRARARAWNERLRGTRLSSWFCEQLSALLQRPIRIAVVMLHYGPLYLLTPAVAHK